ncbi:50S ribosomal protein L11 methyltransferase [Novipirellula sp. SH528]|uniref:50S ribosomal protein L11 methyltransferase n=1 Tax=Novipirellula sp. SH528 TaxID=3454466 RepID=UPI003FA1022E
MRRLKTVLFAWVALSFLGCSREYREDLDYSYGIAQTWPMEQLNYGDLVQFESVPFDLDETDTLRRLILDDSIAANRNVLEVGTGTGLIAIMCQQNDASRVVAIDWNPAAVANARYNAAVLDSETNLEVRLTGSDQELFSAVAPQEKFDLVIVNVPETSRSNLPDPKKSNVGKSDAASENGNAETNDAWRDAMLQKLNLHLAIGGRCLVVCSNKQAITRLIDAAKIHDHQTKVLDSRNWESIEREVRPSVVVEIRVAAKAEIVADGEFVSPASAQ